MKLLVVLFVLSCYMAIRSKGDLVRAFNHTRSLSSTSRTLYRMHIAPGSCDGQRHYIVQKKNNEHVKYDYYTIRCGDIKGAIISSSEYKNVIVFSCHDPGYQYSDIQECYASVDDTLKLPKMQNRGSRMGLGTDLALEDNPSFLRKFFAFDQKIDSANSIVSMCYTPAVVVSLNNKKHHLLEKKYQPMVQKVFGATSAIRKQVRAISGALKVKFQFVAVGVDDNMGQMHVYWTSVS